MLQVAAAAAREAGALLRDGFTQTRTTRAKSSAIDLVTEMDGAAEALLTRRLQEAFPDHGVYGEEDAAIAGDGRYVWHVDPLDGTVNYAHGIPIYAVSLGLLEDGEPLLGVVYDPSRDEMFSALRGEGAYVETATGRHRLSVSRAPTLLDSLLATGFPYDKHSSTLNNLAQFGAFMTRTQGVRRPGSAALDVAYVAAGRLDGYWEYKLGLYDIAAAVLLVAEAGGRFSAPDGTPLRLTPRLDLVASNGLIHEQMIGILRSVHAHPVRTDRPAARD